jgi:hypothetical protein
MCIITCVRRLLRLDGPTFRTSDPLTWTTQRLRLAAPPPTPVWDLVKDYLQVHGLPAGVWRLVGLSELHE